MKQKLLVAGFLSLFAAHAAQAEEVTGFRSAHFGANEKAVTDAISADLGVKAGDVQRAQDPAAKVTTLTAKTKFFEPLNLPASITYVLGYKCNCLIQVNVLWELPEGTTVDQRKTAMVAIGALTNHLMERNWGKDEALTNRVTGDVKEGSENAIVFFRGQNKSGGAITLAGAPVKMTKAEKAPEASAKKTEALAANIDAIKSVLLTYEKDAVNPDAYRVNVNGF